MFCLLVAPVFFLVSTMNVFVLVRQSGSQQEHRRRVRHHRNGIRRQFQTQRYTFLSLKWSCYRVPPSVYCSIVFDFLFPVVSLFPQFCFVFRPSKLYWVSPSFLLYFPFWRPVACVLLCRPYASEILLPSFYLALLFLRPPHFASFCPCASWSVRQVRSFRRWVFICTAFPFYFTFVLFRWTLCPESLTDQAESAWAVQLATLSHQLNLAIRLSLIRFRFS